MRQPVYLAPLLRRAEAGNESALSGIGQIETPEATAALIKLANHPDAKLALAAALTLDNRLPDPQFEGKLPARGPFDQSRLEDRRRLAARCWDARFAPDVRALATRLLGSKTAREAGTGAFMMEAVGTAADAPAVLAALESALEKTMQPRKEPGDNILDDPEPVPELVRAMKALRGRGFASDSPQSGDANIFLYFTFQAGQEKASEDWERMFTAFETSSRYALREAALRSVPSPIPAGCVATVRAALDDPDAGVCRAACEVAGRSGDKDFLPPLLEIVATANHEWLLREATGAAQLLGAGYALLPVWAERLGDEKLCSLALDTLQTAIDVPRGSYSGRTDLSSSERLRLRDAWREFLTAHGAELRAGKRFKPGEAGATGELFGRARQFTLDDGTQWPDGK